MARMIAPSWGRYPKVQQTSLRLQNRHGLPPLDPAERYLPFGNGRSYGDACLNDGGVVLQTRGLDKFIRFDEERGEIECEAGVLLSDILDLVVPKRWFLPVVPGTKLVTVGGAIANDVHGKNHHRAGTFGRHVRQFELMRSDGARLLCSPEQNSEWFGATIGGLGLTGVIATARLALKRIATPCFSGEIVRFGGLDEFFDLAEESDARFEYTAAWVDCLAGGAELGRGLFMRANHAEKLSSRKILRRGLSLNVPVTPPLSLVNPLTLRMFNNRYYSRQEMQTAEKSWDYDSFLFPLDSIGNWNRLYGPKGFLQYQCVVPRTGERDATRDLLKEIARSGQGSFLAVLKTFGETASPGLLSFPMPGTTLALDFPNGGRRTFELLDRLDTIVSQGGGRLYAAKDARMPPFLFENGYSQLDNFRSFMDPLFGSSFERRVMRRTS